MTLPRKQEDRQDLTGRPTAYDVLRDEPSTLFAPRSLEEVFAAAQTSYPRGIAYQARWIAHYENRLAYERAMLAESGGTIADRKAREGRGLPLRDFPAWWLVLHPESGLLGVLRAGEV